MLIRFQVENFLSFNKRTNFSMIPGKIRNKENHIFEANKIKLLRLASIYGANASGKSNFIKSIDFFKFIIEKHLPSNISGYYFRENENNKDKSTTFEVEFIKNKSTYAYGLEVQLSKRRIIAEWLYKLNPDKNTEEMIYERMLVDDEFSVKLNENLVKDKEKVRLDFIISDMKTNYTIPLLSEMNRNKKIEKDSTIYFFREVYDWFIEDLNIFFPNQPITNFSYMKSEENIKNHKIDEILTSFDTGISKTTMEKIDKDEIRNNQVSKILDEFVGRIRDGDIPGEASEMTGALLRSEKEFFEISNVTDDDYNLETIKLRHGHSGITYDFREESDGTRRLFDLLGILLNTGDNKVFIIDELDRSLHPNLSYKFIEEFFKLTSDKNIQLILTTHESKIMDLNLVRQDEVWFVERNNSNESQLYSLDTFKERYDKRIEKAYLDGRYGAIPIFADFESFKNDEG